MFSTDVVDQRSFTIDDTDPSGPDMTAIFNSVPHCPAISIPAGFTPDGLPTGAQLVGRPYDEPTVLRAAHAVERQRPWSGHRPPV